MRKALIVGIDHYEHIPSLSGSVNDARAVGAMLERHENGDLNFVTPRLLTSTSSGNKIDRRALKEAVRELFSGNAEIALLYFAGHGHVEETGGFLCTADSETGDEGFALAELMSIANASQAKNRVIVLDSCHSGAAAARTDTTGTSEIKEGTTILAAATAAQQAMEKPGSGGVFTGLFVDALGGAAANLVGDVTPGSVYAHIDQSLGPWGQRPVFKTNVKSFVSLRKAKPPIPIEDLRALVTHFPKADYKFPLDPAYEPERSEDQRRDSRLPPPDQAKNAVFAVLQRYVRVNLLRPLGAPHMWHAAMESKACELTVLGKHYHALVAKGLI
jgi:hypothetical protein